MQLHAVRRSLRSCLVLLQTLFALCSHSSLVSFRMLFRSHHTPIDRPATNPITRTPIVSCHPQSQSPSYHSSPSNPRKRQQNELCIQPSLRNISQSLPMQPLPPNPPPTHPRNLIHPHNPTPTPLSPTNSEPPLCHTILHPLTHFFYPSFTNGERVCSLTGYASRRSIARSIKLALGLRNNIRDGGGRRLRNDS